MRFPEKPFSYQDLWLYLPSVDLKATTPADFHPDTFDPPRLWSIYLETKRTRFLQEPRYHRFDLLFADFQIAHLGVRTNQITIEQFHQLYRRFYLDAAHGSSISPRGLADLGLMWSDLVQEQDQTRALLPEVQDLTFAAIHRISQPLTRANYLSIFATIFPGISFDQEIEKIIEGSSKNLTPQQNLSDTISSLSRLSSRFSAAEVPLNQLLSRPDIAKLHFETVRALVNHLSANQTLPGWQRVQFMMQVNGLLSRLPRGDDRDRLLESMVSYYSRRGDFDRALDLWRRIDQEVYLNFAVSELIPLALEQGRIEELRHEFEKTYLPKMVADRFAYRYSSAPAPPANSAEVDETAQDAAHWWSLHWYLAVRFMPDDFDWLSLPEVRCFILDQEDNHFELEELLDHQSRHPHPWFDRLVLRRFEKSAQTYRSDDRFNGASQLSHDLLLWSVR